MKKMKTIGIIGGVGPEATVDLYRWIIRLTPARKDQDHIPTIIFSYPQIPDRTEALLYGGEDPTPYLIKAVKVLEKAGADFIAMPCNTGHKFLPQVRKKIQTPILDMIKETRKFISQNYPNVRKIGLLATTGTIKTRVYHDVFEPKGFEIIVPSEKLQEENVMEAIYGEKGIKAGFTDDHPKELMRVVASYLHKQGSEAVIMGCTEIPLVLEDGDDVLVPLINPTRILAQAAVREALKN